MGLMLHLVDAGEDLDLWISPRGDDSDITYSSNHRFWHQCDSLELQKRGDGEQACNNSGGFFFISLFSRIFTCTSHPETHSHTYTHTGTHTALCWDFNFICIALLTMDIVTKQLDSI